MDIPTPAPQPFKLREREPSQDEVTLAFSAVSNADPDRYAKLCDEGHAETLLLGYCLGKGMSIEGALACVRNNPIQFGA